MRFIEMNGSMINLEFVTKIYKDISPTPGGNHMQNDIHICTTDSKETVFHYPKSQEAKMLNDWKYLHEKVFI